MMCRARVQSRPRFWYNEIMVAVSSHPFTTHRYHDPSCGRLSMGAVSCECGFTAWHLANPGFPRFREGKHAVYDAFKVHGPPELSVLVTEPGAMDEFLAGLSERCRGLSLLEEPQE